MPDRRPRPDIVCFRCGRPVGDPPVLNPLGDGEGTCPACAERLLESLPPIFHAPMPFAVAPERDAGGAETEAAGPEGEQSQPDRPDRRSD